MKKTPKTLTFGEWLKQQREERNVTQRELARALKYDSAQFISNIERGVALPPFEAVPVIAQMLRLSKFAVLERIYQEKNSKLEEQYRQHRKEMA